MATLMERLKAKQKADEDRREARLERRRGYAQAGRERARRVAESGLDDLPLEVAVGIEETLEKRTPESLKPPEDVASVEDLVGRLTAVRERLFWLRVDRLLGGHGIERDTVAGSHHSRYQNSFLKMADSSQKAKRATSTRKMTWPIFCAGS